MEKTAREELSSTLLGKLVMVTYDCITSSNCHCMPFNRAACIYDMWIILLDAVIITPPLLVAPVNNNRSSTTFTCLSPIGQNEGGIVSIQWLLNGVFLEDLNLNNICELNICW